MHPGERGASWESQHGCFTALFPKSLAELRLLSNSPKIIIQNKNRRLHFLFNKLAELSKVTNGYFSFPIYKRATTAVPCSRQSLVFRTFYSSHLLCCFYLGIMIKSRHSCKLIIFRSSTRSMSMWWRTSKCLQINFSHIITDTWATNSLLYSW